MDFRLTTPSLASDCYPADAQSFVNEIFDKTRGQLEDLEGVIISETAPGVDDQDKMWVRIDGNGRPTGQFTFIAGQWIWPHPVPASSSSRILYVGAENAGGIWTYDGGDGSDPSVVSPSGVVGAMWEVDHEFDGRIPMGPGAIADIDPVKTLAVGEEYGSGVHTQTSDEVAAHSHNLTSDSNLVENGQIKVATSGSGSSGLLANVTGSGQAIQDLAVQTNNYSSTSGQTAMNIVPPVRGIFVIKRTARTHYVA